MRASVSPSSGQRMRFDIILAPAFTPEALAALTRWRDVRILEAPAGDGVPYDLRRVSGGFLVGEADRKPDQELRLRVVSKREPNEQELADLRFAWKAVKHVKSNAIVLAKEGAMVGAGAGQPNRVTSVHLALRAAGERAPGSALASDAFFPFADSIELAAEGGVRAVVQPGGSLRDDEVIEACDRLGVAMALTGYRHFRH
jgi:phosphoribosylaminoimidazolecarboxamide formyltransferase/IMP cyclohydrolase